MQSVSTEFTRRSKASIRPLSWRSLISFQKTFSSGVTFFTIGTSLIGGNDIIKGDNSVVQEWDKYKYEDYTGRVLSIEYTRESEQPTSPLTLSMATIVLDNHDDYFSPLNTASPIYGYVKPQRPIKLYVGFKNEDIPVFVGVTQGLPKIDQKNKTVTIQCVDFLNSIINTPLDSEVMYVSQRTDQIISSLLITAGLIASQFVLDTGNVIIPFAYFKKGSKLGDALREITEAELGTLYMDEAGVIRFENRTNWATKSQVWGLDRSNVLDITAPSEDKLINVVEVYSNAREVQANQKLWELDNPKEIPANSTLEIFADFKDDYGALPVTNVDVPAYLTSATTSLFATNSARDGSGDTYQANVSLTSDDVFSTTYRMTFTNTASIPVFITQLELFATPAKVMSQIYVRKTSTASIASYDERPAFKIENDYIQDEGSANSIAQIVLSDRAELDDQRVMQIKGVPQLQVGDVIRYTELGLNQTYFVTRINGILNSSGFRQMINVSKRTINTYFRIGISTIGGTDQIAP
jgi:hypothetical protein